MATNPIGGAGADFQALQALQSDPRANNLAANPFLIKPTGGSSSQNLSIRNQLAGDADHIFKLDQDFKTAEGLGQSIDLVI